MRAKAYLFPRSNISQSFGFIDRHHIIKSDMAVLYALKTLSCEKFSIFLYFASLLEADKSVSYIFPNASTLPCDTAFIVEHI